MHARVGMSGFAYKEWKGTFYPDDLKSGDMLGYYATRFPTVEINNTFYRLPKESVLVGWAGQVPDDFTFVLKASRRITHFNRLKDTESERTSWRSFPSGGPWPSNSGTRAGSTTPCTMPCVPGTRRCVLRIPMMA
jgi:uncharacterized protein YecE (DUF72 family)